MLDGNMQKDELIQMHSFLLHLRFHMENMYDYHEETPFYSYDKLGISPIHINKSKNEHNLAVFELSKGIANLICKTNNTLDQRIFNNLENICNQLRK